MKVVEKRLSGCLTALNFWLCEKSCLENLFVASLQAYWLIDIFMHERVFLLGYKS
jgi:hypothetical protein